MSAFSAPFKLDLGDIGRRICQVEGRVVTQNGNLVAVVEKVEVQICGHTLDVTGILLKPARIDMEEMLRDTYRDIHHNFSQVPEDFPRDDGAA